MTGPNTETEGDEQNCPNCGAAFGRDHENDSLDRFEAEHTVVYRNQYGELCFSIEFDCPECDEALLVEDASGPVLGTDPRPNR